eukprot:CAMPEP_0184867246 /NCGR_PEP_ID=MMETSP0580-20130426/25628_1 /TAXON_ID=1118495 /ORGANISM="Dactyliosolen fragilissimus" /LENGTH=123 /DNA_ID=CAMNT_0027367399 /DNA_START=112 /DNA_END=483 /DNA_ORIENTATION=+
MSLSSKDERQSENEEIQPPRSFNPAQFDIFEEGEWSTNINNPYVSARYVKIHQNAKEREREEREVILRRNNESRQESWIEQRRLEREDEETKLMERRQQLIELNAKKRREAWAKAHEENSDNN